MAVSIETIYSDFTKAYTGQPEQVLGFFAEQPGFLTGIESFSNKRELQLYIELNWQYFNAMFKTKEYNTLVIESDRIQSLIDKEMERLNAGELKDKWYYGLAFFTGIANYQLKNYKASTAIFRSLIEIDSGNSNYKTWLSHSLSQQRLNVLAIVYLVLAAVAFIGITLLFTVPQYKEVWQTIALVCFLAIMASFSYESFSKYKLRKAVKI